MRWSGESDEVDGESGWYLRESCLVMAFEILSVYDTAANRCPLEGPDREGVRRTS